MKTLRLLPCLFLALLSCTEPDSEPSPDLPQATTGTPTEVGSPVGAAVTKTLGPAGGILELPGSSVRFIFPTRAIAKETAITLQAVENKAWGGTGTAYALTPQNLQLNKDAQIVWQYTPDALDGSAPEALGVAYQDEAGIWQGRTDVQLNKATSTATAPVSRLAHWSFYEQFYIESDKSVLAPMDQTWLKVYFQDGRNDRHDHDHPEVDLLAPLVRPELVSATRVVRWTINGVTAGSAQEGDFSQTGQITEDRTLAKAQYAAPPREPDTNPVAVGAEVDLKQWGRVVLVKKVQIEAEAFLNIDGAGDHNPNVGLTLLGTTLSGLLNARNGASYLTFTIENFKGKGTYDINPGHTVHITPVIAGRIPYLDSYYNKDNVWISGGGKITITEYSGAGKPIAGRVTGNFFWQKSLTEMESVPASAKFRAVAVAIP